MSGYGGSNFTFIIFLVLILLLLGGPGFGTYEAEN